MVKVDVAGERLISAAEGNGPVNALDVALRKDLGKYQKYIEGLKLIDYRVRILNGGTEAVTRVLIESEDENGDRWTTIGVSPNIIDASFQALMDSVVYKLVKSGAGVGIAVVPSHGVSPVIASEAKQSRSTERTLDCFVALLLAMTLGPDGVPHDRPHLRRRPRSRTCRALL